MSPNVKSLCRALCCLLASALLAPAALAQGGPPQGGGRQGGNRWDPAQMQQRMMERLQESLAASAEEWQVIQPRLQTVFEKQRALRELQANRGFRRPDAEPAPEVAALEKAIDSGDATAIKAGLEALRKARVAQEAEVAKAQDALREVLSLSQEARLVLSGMLE